MELIKANRILQFNENQVQNVRKTLGYEDVNKLKQDIEQLRDWIQKQNHFRVKEFDDNYLERWLIINKGSIERTKQKFDKLCTFTNLMPEFLQNFDMKNDFRALRNISHNTILPKPTNDNYRIFITNFTGLEDKDFEMVDPFRYYILMMHYIMHNDYSLGLILIVDFSNVTLGTVTKINPIVLSKGFNVFTEALAQRIKLFHLISGSKFFDTVVNLIKQGLSAKLKSRLMVHPNIESLYEYVPREKLPKEYGGDEMSTKEINAAVFEELCSEDNMAKVKFMESLATDESLRVSCKFNEEYSGIPGSFKSLCVD